MTFQFSSSMETREDFMLNPVKFLTKRNRRFTFRQSRNAINWRQDVGMNTIEESFVQHEDSYGNNSDAEQIGMNSDSDPSSLSVE